jgi:hypothetical protein
MIYVRNPIMSISRLIAGICVGLFFGGAFWNLQRNIGGYEARSSEGFAYKLMVPGFGSAAISYWLEKRKMFYHEEAAGYYHRLGHLLVMFFVEWIFLSAIMSVLGGIMFTMSNWISSNIGYYIAFMICEAFASTAINLTCAYIAASIPYANATFTLYYYYAILMYVVVIRGQLKTSKTDSFHHLGAVSISQTPSSLSATLRSRSSGNGSRTAACGSSPACALRPTGNPSSAPTLSASRSTPTASPSAASAAPPRT